MQLVKARSSQLREPLGSDMKNDEIFVSKDSIHILKHHGSYMQQVRARVLPPPSRASNRPTLQMRAACYSP